MRSVGLSNKSINMHTRFVVDAMLGSIARKLRLFGFDTLYYSSIEDSHILSICMSEDRALVTLDEELHHRACKHGIKSILVSTHNDDTDAMVSILKALDIKDIEFNAPNSRCPSCNSSLEQIDKESLKGSIHESTFMLYSNFYICKGCSKIYWEGSHVKRLRMFVEEVNRRLVG